MFFFTPSRLLFLNITHWVILNCCWQGTEINSRPAARKILSYNTHYAKFTSKAIKKRTASCLPARKKNCIWISRLPATTFTFL